MKIVIAIDSFKGSMTSLEAGHAAETGIKRVCPDAEIIVQPLADGGEGTTEALTSGLGGHFQKCMVTGPKGSPVSARYGILSDEKTAVMDMAEAAGIILVKDKKDPLHASTYGVGEMIRNAIFKGCRKFIIGIGGSATNDGGVGMLQALGYEFYDNNDCILTGGADILAKIARIEPSNILKDLSDCEFQIACDVTNPLCGSCGATHIYGPQKGVTHELLPVLDSAMHHYAEVAAQLLNHDFSNIPGTGAAGGIGFAFLAFLNARLVSGIDLVLNTIHLEDYLKDADFVITGEGQLDGQTAMGKVPVCVAKLAKKYSRTVLAFAGSVTTDAKACNAAGIDAYFPIVRGVTTLENAMDNNTALKNMSDSVEQVFRLIACS